MALFRRKEQAPQPQANEFIIHFDGSATPSQKPIIERLADSISGSRIEGDAVILPISSASVRVEVIRNTNVAGLAVTIDHPGWDRVIYDEAAGVSDNPAEALNKALINVYFNLVHLIDHHSSEAPDDRLTTTWAGAEHRWSVWQGYVLTLAGRHEGEDRGYWGLFRDLLPSRLGNQKVAYVKVTASSVPGSCEVRINNQISVELTQVLYDYVRATWAGDQAMKKQFFWIVQDEATYQPYPYTAADIRGYVMGAGKIFWELDQDDSGASDEDLDKEYESRLVQMTRDPWLAKELQLLLPEIVADGMMKVPLSDNLVIQSGPARHELTYHQLACFAPFREAVFSAWQQELTDQILQSWQQMSGMYWAIKEAMENGLTEEDFNRINPIVSTFNFGEGYQLR